MTEDEMMWLASEAGIRIKSNSIPNFQKFVELVANAERKECAELVRDCCKHCAKTILQRGQKNEVLRYLS